MWNLLSLDGFFEGDSRWDLSWHPYIWGAELERFSLEQLRTADRLLFGCVTYEGMAAYWRTATGEIADYMNRLPKVVFSRTLERPDWMNTRLVKGDLVSEIEALKRQGDGITFGFGSATLSAALTEHGLFDEYRLAVAPVLLGRGRPLFGSCSSRQRDCNSWKPVPCPTEASSSDTSHSELKAASILSEPNPTITCS